MHLLAAYQKRWIGDPARRKIVVKSRRIGFSFATALEIAISALAGEREYIVSASQMQSNELLREVKNHLTVAGAATTQELFSKDPAVTLLAVHGGGEIRSMSSLPRSLRGPGGNLTLDEYAWCPNNMEVWKAAKAITDPTLGKREGYKLRIISTPAGDDDDNMFYRLFMKDDGATFSKHNVNIYDAVSEGFPIDVDECRRECVDDDIFEQEYNCSFLAASLRYISAELYDRSIFLEDALPQGFPHQLYAGMDVARERDNSAIEQGMQVGDTLWNYCGEARRGVEWEAQELWADEVMAQPYMRKMCVDKTGIGSMFAERLEKRYGSRVEGVGFTNDTKEALATGLKLAYSRGRLRVRDDLDLRRDVLNLRREITKAGNVRFDAKRTKSGHADRAWAQALMVHAAGGFATEYEQVPAVLSGRRRQKRLDW